MNVFPQLAFYEYAQNELISSVINYPQLKTDVIFGHLIFVYSDRKQYKTGNCYYFYLKIQV